MRNFFKKTAKSILSPVVTAVGMSQWVIVMLSIYILMIRYNFKTRTEED